MQTDGGRTGFAGRGDRDEAELDRLWGEEAERRLGAYREGAARSWPAEDVYAAAERLLTEHFR